MGHRPALVNVWSVRAAAAGLWLLVAAGPVLGAAALVTGAQAAPPVGPPAVAGSSTGAEGFAELFVAEFVAAGEGDEERLEGFFPAVGRLEGASGGLYAARTVTVAAEPLGAGLWAVTVAVELLAADDGGYTPAGLRFYRVGVLAGPRGFVATGLPGVVPAPATADLPRLGVERLSAREEGPQTQALDGFFAAFLAADGDLERYVAPGSGIRPVRPPPFASARVRAVGLRPRAGAEEVYVANVSVAGVTAAGDGQLLQYAVELARRDGRWEVSRLLPAVPTAAAARAEGWSGSPADERSRP